MAYANKCNRKSIGRKLILKYIKVLLRKSLSDIDTDIDNLCGLDLAVKKVDNFLCEAELSAAHQGKKPRRRTSRLKVWSPDILKAVDAKKGAFCAWKQAGRPNDSSDQTVINKKLTTVSLRQAIRFEHYNKQVQIRQEILEARSHN